MGLPGRPRQHELADQSEVAFRRLLPPRLIYREVPRDYGIDGEVELVEEAGQATGRKFLVQLKATDNAEIPEALREQIRNSAAEYMRAQQAPVLLVRYLAASDAIYGRWFHEFDPYYEHVGDRHVTFHWSIDDLLTEDNVERLVDEATRLIELRRGELRMPVPVALQVPEGGAHDHSRAELRLALEAAIGRCPADLLLVEAESEAYLTAAIRGDLVQASLSGMWSTNFHLEEGMYPPGTPAELMACDVMSCVALTLARAGRPDAAARVAVPFFSESCLTAVPPMVVELATALIEARRITEVLEIADRLDQHPDDTGRPAASYFMMNAVQDHAATLQPHERAQAEATLHGRLERRLEAGRTRDAAAAAENLGQHLMVTFPPSSLRYPRSRMAGFSVS